MSNLLDYVGLQYYDAQIKGVLGFVEKKVTGWVDATSVTIVIGQQTSRMFSKAGQRLEVDTNIGVFSYTITQSNIDNFPQNAALQEGMILPLEDVSGEYYLDIEVSEVSPGTVVYSSAGSSTGVNIESDLRLITETVHKVDDMMSDTSTNPVQNRVVKAYIDTRSSVGVLTAPFTLGRAVGSWPQGHTWPIGTSTEALLRDLFGPRQNGQVFACELETKSAYIDTGLTQDYSYKFRAVGRTPEGLASVLLGAYTANDDRTTMRLMGGGNSFQHMWPGLTQITFDNTGLTPREIFEYTQDKDGVIITQNGQTHTATVAGTQSGVGAAAIHLLQESGGTSRGNGILREAQIWDANGTLLRDFRPWYLDGEIVIVDVANGNQIYRPSSGGLLEVEA